MRPARIHTRSSDSNRIPLPLSPTIAVVIAVLAIAITACPLPAAVTDLRYSETAAGFIWDFEWDRVKTRNAVPRDPDTGAVPLKFDVKFQTLDSSPLPGQTSRFEARHVSRLHTSGVIDDAHGDKLTTRETTFLWVDPGSTDFTRIGIWRKEHRTNGDTHWDLYDLKQANEPGSTDIRLSLTGSHLHQGKPAIADPSMPAMFGYNPAPIVHSEPGGLLSFGEIILTDVLADGGPSEGDPLHGARLELAEVQVLGQEANEAVLSDTLIQLFGPDQERVLVAEVGDLYLFDGGGPSPSTQLQGRLRDVVIDNRIGSPYLSQLEQVLAAGDRDLFVGLETDLYAESDQLTQPAAVGGLAYLAFDALEFVAASGDFNDDGVVDGEDFIIWQRNFPRFDGDATYLDGDADGDGHVTGEDFLLWQQQAFNQVVGSGGRFNLVPEPAAMVLGLLTLLATALRRRRN